MLEAMEIEILKHLYKRQQKFTNISQSQYYLIEEFD